jgi:hypothetical protein
MSAVHHSAFSNCFNIRERARMSRTLAEAVERQQSRGELKYPQFRADLRQQTRAELEAKRDEYNGQ